MGRGALTVAGSPLGSHERFGVFAMIDDTVGRRAVRLARRAERSRNSAAAGRSGTVEGGQPTLHLREDVHKRGLEAAKRALASHHANQRSPS